VFDKFIEQAENDPVNEEDEEEGSGPPKFKFQWHCKEGLPSHILKLSNEFN